ncbi:amidohydrolase family protein [Luedemannella flava]
MQILLTEATLWAGVECVPRAGWLLLDGDRVVAVGDGDPPPADSVIAKPGAHVLPGLIDSHLHLTTSAWQSRGGDGRLWTDVHAAVAAVRAAAHADPDAPWLLFWNARPFAWPERRLPTAAELDAAAPGRRVLISGLDLHRGAASPAALAALGAPMVYREDDLVRDRRGRPTGELWSAPSARCSRTRSRTPRRTSPRTRSRS